MTTFDEWFEKEFPDFAKTITGADDTYRGMCMQIKVVACRAWNDSYLAGYKDGWDDAVSDE